MKNKFVPFEDQHIVCDPENKTLSLTDDYADKEGAEALDEWNHDATNRLVSEAFNSGYLQATSDICGDYVKYASFTWFASVVIAAIGAGAYYVIPKIVEKLYMRKPPKKEQKHTEESK